MHPLFLHSLYPTGAALALPCPLQVIKYISHSGTGFAKEKFYRKILYPIHKRWAYMASPKDWEERDPAKMLERDKLSQNLPNSIHVPDTWSHKQALSEVHKCTSQWWDPLTTTLQNLNQDGSQIWDIKTWETSAFWKNTSCVSMAVPDVNVLTHQCPYEGQGDRRQTSELQPVSLAGPSGTGFLHSTS